MDVSEEVIIFGNGAVAVCTGRMPGDHFDTELIIADEGTGRIGEDTGLSGQRTCDIKTISRWRFLNTESLDVVLEALGRIRQNLPSTFNGGEG